MSKDLELGKVSIAIIATIHDDKSIHFETQIKSAHDVSWESLKQVYIEVCDYFQEMLNNEHMCPARPSTEDNVIISTPKTSGTGRNIPILTMGNGMPCLIRRSRDGNNWSELPRVVDYAMDRESGQVSITFDPNDRAPADVDNIIQESDRLLFLCPDKINLTGWLRTPYGICLSNITEIVRDGNVFNMVAKFEEIPFLVAARMYDTIVTELYTEPSSGSSMQAISSKKPFLETIQSIESRFVHSLREKHNPQDNASTRGKRIYFYKETDGRRSKEITDVIKDNTIEELGDIITFTTTQHLRELKTLTDIGVADYDAQYENVRLYSDLTLLFCMGIPGSEKHNRGQTEYLYRFKAGRIKNLSNIPTNLSVDAPKEVAIATHPIHNLHTRSEVGDSVVPELAVYMFQNRNYLHKQDITEIVALPKIGVVVGVLRVVTTQPIDRPETISDIWVADFTTHKPLHPQNVMMYRELSLISVNNTGDSVKPVYEYRFNIGNTESMLGSPIATIETALIRALDDTGASTPEPTLFMLMPSNFALTPTETPSEFIKINISIYVDRIRVFPNEKFISLQVRSDKAHAMQKTLTRSKQFLVVAADNSGGCVIEVRRRENEGDMIYLYGSVTGISAEDIADIKTSPVDNGK